MRFHSMALASLTVLMAGCGNAPPDESIAVDPGALGEGATIDSILAPDSAHGGAVIVPGRVPVFGRSIASWTTSWYRWHFAVPADVSPILHLDQDCGTRQNEPVFFVPTFDNAAVYERTCRVPLGKPVLVPLRAVINDYPCPDPTFKPAPGQSLEDFLREGAVEYDDGVRDLAVTVDGEAVSASSHRHTSGLFHFVGHPSLVGQIPDACLLSATSQPGVVDGWWLMLLLGPGEHVVQSRGLSPEGEPFDTKYRLQVARLK